MTGYPGTKYIVNPISQSLLAGTTIYVSTTGNDNNSGLAPWFAKATIEGAINAIPEGKFVQIQCSPGIFNFSQIVVPVQGLRLSGVGCNNGVGAAFGSASWVPSAMSGTILVCTQSTNDAITANNATSSGTLILENLGVLGPGEGTTNGINIGHGGLNNFQTGVVVSNVQVMNFSTGWNLQGVEDSTFIKAWATGCQNGIVGDDATNNNAFINAAAQYTSILGISIAGSANEFSAPLCQDTTGTASLQVSGALNQFHGLYTGNPTPPTQTVDLLSGATRTTIDGWYSDGGGSTMTIASGVGGCVVRQMSGTLSVTDSNGTNRFEYCQAVTLSGGGASFDLVVAQQDALLEVPIGFQFSGTGNRFTVGLGAPSKPGGLNPTAGDGYWRIDTPSTSDQRLYICTTGGASPVWSGIV